MPGYLSSLDETKIAKYGRMQSARKNGDYNANFGIFGNKLFEKAHQIVDKVISLFHNLWNLSIVLTIL